MLVEIGDVALEPLPRRLRGRHLDLPKRGSRVEAHDVRVVGWALGHEVPSVAVELLVDGQVFQRAPLGVARPDLGEAFPDAPEAGRAGFRAHVGALTPPDGLLLEVRTVLRDHVRLPLGRLQLRRAPENGRDDRALVSVAIPCYDQAHFLAEAIESVLAQTYPHVEVVVVDDGSHDNTGRVAARYPGVRCVRQENQGLAAARNRGIRESDGDFLLFLDADDRLLPHAIEIGLDELEAHPECAFVAGRAAGAGDDDTALPSPHSRGPDHYRELLRRNFLALPAVLYRRSAFEAAGVFDPSFDPVADYDLNLRIVRAHPVRVHREIVAEAGRHVRDGRYDRRRAFAAAAVLRRQRAFVRNAPLRATYDDALASWRRAHGRRLADDVAFLLARRDWGDALQTAGALLRHHPRALRSHVRVPFRG